MKTLYLDCGMGAAGDMLTAALVELLPDPDGFLDKVNALGIPGVLFRRKAAVKCGITGTQILVTVDGTEEESGGHHHRHDGGHGHSHRHSGLQDIEHMVRGHLPVSDKVKSDIMAVYQLIAEAEGKAHGVPVTDIHFHEVGTMDAIADITAVCMLMEELSPGQVIVSPIHVGSGQVSCAHGTLPVPAPATAYILQNVPIYGGCVRGELCTPTGAALLKRFATQFGEMPPMEINAIGYGMGKKEFEAANCVRAFLGETQDTGGKVTELSCNMDDMTGEAIGFAMEMLFEAGALDVYTLPVGMKKSRPGTMLCVMCREADKNTMVSLLFKHTSTLGVRERTCRKYRLDRTVETVETTYGAVRKKISTGYGIVREKYEYEDIAEIARSRGSSVSHIMRTIRKLPVLLLCLLLTACQGGTDGKSTLVYGSGDYTSINPIMNEHCEIKQLLFDGLMARDGDGSLIPALAEACSYDEAAMIYTFKLREGVKWHDGEEFTAEDVKFTIEAIMDPGNGSENRPNYEEIREIQILGDYEIAFALSEPNSAFLDYMTMSILPQHKLEGEDMWESGYFRVPIGTGPYQLERWDTGQSIYLVKNEDYYGGAAKIDAIIFKIVEEDKAKALQLQSGELDLAQVTPKDAAIFEGKSGYTVYVMDTADYRGILYNFRNPYWQENADLIPAINYAIDRQAILDTVLLGYGEVAYGPLQKNVYHNGEVERYEYDPAEAKAALAAAGCEQTEGFWTRDGERIAFTINAMPGDQVRIDMAQIAAQQLREIGLDVTAGIPAEGIDWGGQECCIIGWGSPFDADDHTYKVFGTDKGANYSGYSNPLVDQYLAEARQAQDSGARAEAYARFQEELARTPAYTFFCYLDALYVASGPVQGIDADTLLGHHGAGIFWNICQWTVA